ncbi:MAG: porin, partial [Gammaproteobacteria bacterium]|nr:porin [Gammaproteobacteria bacterium]
MKNIVLSAAIAAICAAPVAAMADTQLYGQMRYSFNSIDDKTNADPAKHKDGLSGEDNVSLFGLKGSAGDDDLKAFYHIQTGALADGDADSRAFKQRFYFAGLQGGFGKVAYGRMTNAYKFDGFKLDPYYNLSHVGASGSFAAGGASYGLSNATNGFTDNALQYTSPAFSGVKVNAGVYIDDTNEDDHGTNIGASWSGNGINVGIQFASNSESATATKAVVPGIAADGDALRIHGGYKADNWSAGLSYETVDTDADAEANYLYLVGRFNVSKKTELIATVGMVDPDDNSKEIGAEGTGFQLGVFQTVVPKTQLYVSYGTADLDNNDEDPSVLSI